VLDRQIRGVMYEATKKSAIRVKVPEAAYQRPEPRTSIPPDDAPRRDPFFSPLTLGVTFGTCNSKVEQLCAFTIQAINKAPRRCLPIFQCSIP
jgi:hypothetical protein